MAKLNKGDAKKKRKRPVEDADPGGLRKGFVEDEECVAIDRDRPLH